MTTQITVIETSANQFFQVRECQDAALSHCWIGIAVRKTKNGFIRKAGAKQQLVRKAATKVVIGENDDGRACNPFAWS